MKKNILLVLGLLLTVTMVYAQAKPVKAKKIIDPTVPVEESAFIYVPKNAIVYYVDDTKFGTYGVLSMGNLKGEGGTPNGKIAKPILQVPAGERVVAANVSENDYYKGRKVTYTFLPGHYYQIVLALKGSIGEAMRQAMKDSFVSGIGWCFFDITEEIKAGKKDFSERWVKAVNDEVLGQGHVIEKFTKIEQNK